MFPIYSTTAHKSKRKACTKNQKAKDNAWNPGCRTKEIDVIAISNRKEVHTTETIHRQKAQERKDQLPTSAIPPIDQATIRKALAPFSIICQNMTQIEFEQCSKR